MDGLSTRIASLESRISRIDQMNCAVEECKKQCEEQQRMMRSVMAKVDHLLSHRRRCNLLFFGVTERKPNESNEDSEECAIDVCKSKLGIESVKLENVHRIGKFKSGKNRPLIASFVSFTEKQKVLKNAYKLKGGDVSVSEDFCEEVRKKRKHLRDFAKLRNQSGGKISLRYDTLIMNGVKYVYDDNTSEVVPVA